MEYRKTHLINEHGNRQVVETRNADEEIRLLNESTNSTYYLDVDWYLANGYSKAEDAFRRIENQVPKNIHFPAEEAKRLAKQYAKSLIYIKEYNGQEGTSDK